MKKWRFINRIILVSFSFIFIGCITGKGTYSSGEKEKVFKANVTPRSERKGLAVIQFINATSREEARDFQPWEYGIAVMLTTDLERTELFNIVDRGRLNDILREQTLQKTEIVDSKTAVTIGRLIAAHYILAGTFMIVGEDLRIMAQVFSVEEGMQLGAIQVAGKTKQFFLVEKELFTKITATLKVVLDDEKQAGILKKIETTSVDASLKNYAGETAMLMADEMKKLGKEKETEKFLIDAKKDFKEALYYDPKYKRAKENLRKAAMAIPMTL